MKYKRIQILRFLAAAVVVFFHSIGTSGKYFQGQTHLAIFTHGDLGVDLFFVISGFIIFIVTDHRERDPGLFISRRIERIVPMYWICSFVMFSLLNMLYTNPSERPSLALLVKSLFFLSWVDRQFPIVYPGWTVEYEMAFYLVVAVALSLTSKIWHFVIIIFSACVVFGLVNPSFSYPFLTNPMYMEFVLGIIVAHLVLRRRLPAIACVIAAVVIAAITILPWTENMWRLVVAGLPASLLVLSTAMLDRAKVPLSRLGNLMSHFGDASYSIYLVQVIFISIICKVLRFVAPDTPIDLAAVLVGLTTIALAYGVHRAIERPLGAFFHLHSLHTRTAKWTV